MIRVLLVDDHDLVRTGVRKILEAAVDISVVGEASSGEAALQVAAALAPDVVLMDVNMPGLGGIETTRRLLRLVPNTKVIVLTVHEEDPFPTHLRAAGAVGYLTKKCAAREVLEGIRTVHQGRPYVATSVARKHILADWEGASRTPFAELSAREMEVVLMILQGHSSQEISDVLCLSPKTVGTYRMRLFEKLKVKGDVELTRLAFRYGILADEA